jgi:hypothetical protein
MPDQNPGIKLGRIEAGGVKFRRPEPSDLVDNHRIRTTERRHGNTGICNRRHQFVSSAASSAA